MSFIGTQLKCKACEKTFYPVDQLSADGTSYHKACFRCTHCKGTLKLSNYSSMEGVLYCKPHFEQLFKEHDNFSKNFQSPATTSSPQPLQYVVNAAFLATLYSDYLDAADTPGWYCGPNFYSTEKLREFARTQINYILGKNPRKMSYIVGFGNHYPKHVHHRGASIPKNKVKYNCKGGWKWRDTSKPNPNILIGVMVAGPDRHDGFHDVRSNYNYTEPTLAGNAGLVAALVALSGDKSIPIDKNTLFLLFHQCSQHHHQPSSSPHKHYHQSSVNSSSLRTRALFHQSCSDFNTFALIISMLSGNSAILLLIV